MSLPPASGTLTHAERRVVDLLVPRRVLTLEELTKGAQVSHVTVFSALRKHGYYRSFNQNGRYYALRETPRFDERGLWRWRRQAGFSVHGSLRATVQAWVCDSVCGVTSQELSVALRAQVDGTLRALAAQGALVRQAWRRQYVYFSGQESEGRKQRQRYLERTAQGQREVAAGALPKKDTVIEILVEMLRRPRSSAKNLRRRMNARGGKVSRAEVDAVLTHYQIGKKKLCRGSGALQ
jgi:hypothetical protein